MNAMQGNTMANPAAQQMLAQFMQQGQQPILKTPESRTTTVRKGTPLTAGGVLSNIVDQTIMPVKNIKNGFDFNANKNDLKKAFGLNELRRVLGGQTTTTTPNMQMLNQPPPIDWSAMMQS